MSISLEWRPLGFLEAAHFLLGPRLEAIDYAGFVPTALA
jgi:hypothetical protein